MTSERSKRRDFLSLIFIAKSISKKLLIKVNAIALKLFSSVIIIIIFQILKFLHCWKKWHANFTPNFNLIAKKTVVHSRHVVTINNLRGFTLLRFILSLCVELQDLHAASL